jgi:DNA polymerase-3 subunit beta
MQFNINRDQLLKSLNFVQGVVEKKNTLPILSNVLLNIKENKLEIIATDLDIVFYDEIENLKIIEAGNTTTSANVLFDILRKIPQGAEINFTLKSENKLSLKTKNSDFNLLCLPATNFPTFDNNFNTDEIKIDKKKFLSLLNKTKISISNDDTRHYLNGIYLHATVSEKNTFLTGVATDSHRLSSSSIQLDKLNNFSSIIIPRKTVFTLCSLLDDSDESFSIQISDNKIKFILGKIVLISKVIDGKFPDYQKVVPKDNSKILTVLSDDFINSVERVASVSLDRKEGVKLELTKDQLKLSVNSTNSGDGNEVVSAKYTGENLTIGFNSKYLIDIASEVEDKNLTFSLKDSTSPVLVLDNSDKNSFYVIMPMKI